MASKTTPCRRFPRQAVATATPHGRQPSSARAKPLKRGAIGGKADARSPASKSAAGVSARGAWVPSAEAGERRSVSAKASAEPASSKGKTQPAAFYRVRLLTFVGILVGYSCYYLTRNSLTYTAPVMVASKELGLDVSSIGAMTSIFPIAYGMSKFVSGVLGSMMSASRLLGLGLICTGLINVFFGFGSSLAWFCTLWAMNGVLQGVGGPCCARILTSWFATEERGTYWGMWNIAHNLGGKRCTTSC